MSPMQPAARRRARFLAAFVAWFAVLWLLWYTPIVYPLKLFVVLLHEASHALAAVATGGEVRAIAVTPDEGGVCACPGGNAFLTLSAGYLGSLGWGAVLTAAAVAGGRWRRVAVGAAGAAVLLLSLLYVRNGFGLAFGLLFGAGLAAAAFRLGERANVALLLALGLTSCLYAILDIKSDILDRPHLRSDAALLSELTGVPTLAWGALWIAAALAVSWWLLRWAWRRA